MVCLHLYIAQWPVLVRSFSPLQSSGLHIYELWLCNNTCSDSTGCSSTISFVQASKQFCISVIALQEVMHRTIRKVKNKCHVGPSFMLCISNLSSWYSQVPFWFNTKMSVISGISLLSTKNTFLFKHTCRLPPSNSPMYHQHQAMCQLIQIKSSR